MNVHVELRIMIRPQLYFRLLRRFIPYWKLLSLALFAMLIMAASLASLPIFIKQMLDSAFILKDPSLLQTTSLAIIALFIVRGMAGYVSITAVNKASSQLGVDLRTDIFSKLLTLPAGHYTHLNKNNEIDTLIFNINQITYLTARHITILAQDCLTITGLMICILYLNQEFSVLLLLVSPLVILIIQITHDHLNKLDQKTRLASNKLIQQLHQSIQHYREIRLDGGQMHECQRLGKIAEPVYHAEMQQAMIRATIIPLGQIITALILIAIIYFILQQTLNHGLSLDEVGALIAATLLLISPIQRIAGIPKQLQHDQKKIETLFSFLDQVSEQDTGTQNIQPIYGKLTFEHVRFFNATQTKPILNHISFTFKPGETIVFTGYTENEKNAFIDLILRFQQPTSGKILLDDYPLADIEINNLHSNIALVSENSVLLDEKVADNIAYGAMRCANEAKITAAAQASHAMEFIREMPEGLQTRIGEEGIKISKKQCQQIAIARALLKDSPILILDGIPATDEPDSGHLLSTLEKLIQNRTTLIFNPHIPNLKKIDRIVVLENGCIIENLTNTRHSA